MIGTNEMGGTMGGVMNTRTPRARSTGLAIVVIAVIAALLAVSIAACGSSSDSGTPNDAELSAETRAFLDNAMPALDQVMADWQAGKAAKAAKGGRPSATFPRPRLWTT